MLFSGCASARAEKQLSTCLTAFDHEHTIFAVTLTQIYTVDALLLVRGGRSHACRTRTRSNTPHAAR